MCNILWYTCQPIVNVTGNYVSTKLVARSLTYGNYVLIIYKLPEEVEDAQMYQDVIR